MAKRSKTEPIKKTNGVYHLPGRCSKCGVEYFNRRWTREKFISTNIGTAETLGESYDNWQAYTGKLHKEADLDIEIRVCDKKCDHVLEILIDPIIE